MVRRPDDREEATCRFREWRAELEDPRSLSDRSIVKRVRRASRQDDLCDEEHVLRDAARVADCDEDEAHHRKAKRDRWQFVRDKRKLSPAS